MTYLSRAAEMEKEKKKVKDSKRMGSLALSIVDVVEVQAAQCWSVIQWPASYKSQKKCAQ